ncbi:hypothetical protein KQ738_16400, partial [Listeria monocytogenes]|nr:hypothetical protein [Listeria monocytogenes]
INRLARTLRTLTSQVLSTATAQDSLTPLMQQLLHLYLECLIPDKAAILGLTENHFSTTHQEAIQSYNYQSYRLNHPPRKA